LLGTISDLDGNAFGDDLLFDLERSGVKWTEICTIPFDFRGWFPMSSENKSCQATNAQRPGGETNFHESGAMPREAGDSIFVLSHALVRGRFGTKPTAIKEHSVLGIACAACKNTRHK
jgi:hypothetical protein